LLTFSRGNTFSVVCDERPAIRNAIIRITSRIRFRLGRQGLLRSYFFAAIARLREKTSAIYQKLMNELIARAVAFRSNRLGFREIILIPKLAILLARFGLDSTSGGAQAGSGCPYSSLQPGWNFFGKHKQFM
jgi:hypothetical protein